MYRHGVYSGADPKGNAGNGKAYLLAPVALDAIRRRLEEAPQPEYEQLTMEITSVRAYTERSGEYDPAPGDTVSMWAVHIRLNKAPAYIDIGTSRLPGYGFRVGDNVIYHVKTTTQTTTIQLVAVGKMGETITAEATLEFALHCTGITYNVTSNVKTIGETTQYVTTVSPAGCTDPVTYSSSDESVATVDENGVITGVGFGCATITVTCGDYSASHGVCIGKTVNLTGTLVRQVASLESETDAVVFTMGGTKTGNVYFDKEKFAVPAGGDAVLMKDENSSALLEHMILFGEVGTLRIRDVGQTRRLENITVISEKTNDSAYSRALSVHNGTSGTAYAAFLASSDDIYLNVYPAWSVPY